MSTTTPDPSPASWMRQEALSAPARVEALLAHDAPAYAALAQQLRARSGHALLTLARGSSDHAAQHLAYLMAARLGRLVTSLPMSLLTLYGAALPAPALVAFAFSQSGRSPDLVEPTQRLRAGGALTVALVNDTASPLAAAAECVLPLHAGEERSVAATKSCIAQLVAGARLVGACEAAAGDGGFAAAVDALPAALAQATAPDWGAGVAALQGIERMYVVGRGPGLAVAQEVALKFKETCAIQAEAFSGAELQHGPMALVGAGFPVLVLATRGPAQAGLIDLALALHARGAQVLVAVPPAARAAPGAAGVPTLPLATAAHADLDAIPALLSAYLMVEALARARGRDPDRPPFLAKVTQTR